MREKTIQGWAIRDDGVDRKRGVENNRGRGKE